jgi:predicted hydrocarbon binding protein
VHGIIFAELRRYVDSKLGPDAWGKLVKEAGTARKLYMPIQEYPDQEAAALVGAASKITGKPAAEILEDFGQFITPTLLGMYSSLVKREWKTLDLIENAEKTIHTVVRTKNPGAHPPELNCERKSPNEVILLYSSRRRMCAVAKGIAKGLGKHYNERIVVSESTCMHGGSPNCTISIKSV